MLEAKDQGHRRKCSLKKVFKIFFEKKGLQNFFSGDLQFRGTKKVFANFPRGFWRFPTKFQRFKKNCGSLAEDRAIFEDVRLRGQGLDLRGQGLQNVSSRPKTSLRTEVQSRTEGSRPRPRTQKKNPRPRTSLRTEVQSRTEGSRPRTQKKNPRPRTTLSRTKPLEAKDTGASVLHKKKFFQAISKKKKLGLQKNFASARVT